MVVATSLEVDLEEAVLLILDIAALVALSADRVEQCSHLFSTCAALLAVGALQKHAARTALSMKLATWIERERTLEKVLLMHTAMSPQQFPSSELHEMVLVTSLSQGLGRDQDSSRRVLAETKIVGLTSSWCYK